MGEAMSTYDACEEEYHSTHTCEVCGGESGRGWSTCRCDDDGDLEEDFRQSCSRDTLVSDAFDDWLENCGYVPSEQACTKAGSEACAFECPLHLTRQLHQAFIADTGG